MDNHSGNYDPVNRPEHYLQGGIETIDFIQAKLGDDGLVAYCMGNALKYISRAGHKDPAKFSQDLHKAIWYLKKASEVVDGY